MPYIENAPELNRTNHVALIKKIYTKIFDNSILRYHKAFTKDNARKYALLHPKLQQHSIRNFHIHI